MPTKTCFGTFGFTATALAGMFGRFPVLFTHVYVLQKVVHVSWKR